MNVKSSKIICNVEWNKANNEHIGKYRNFMDVYLSNIVIFSCPKL